MKEKSTIGDGHPDSEFANELGALHKYENSEQFRFLTALHDSPQLHSYLPSRYMPGRHLSPTCSCLTSDQAEWQAPGPLVMQFQSKL